MSLNTLVIGGGGLIGHHLVPLLLESGRQVSVMGRHARPLYPLPRYASYVAGDFGDPGLVSGLLSRHGEVVHMAYATVPNTSFDDPLGDLLQNLPPTVRLFIEAAKRDCRLVFISSGGTVYGPPRTLPIPEDHPTAPISPYGLTKLTLEKYAHLYAATHGLKAICVRPANAYGAGQRPFSGQGFVATAMASAMLGRTIKLFGEGKAVRDYVYASDIAAGIVSVLERGQIGATYNLGSGVGVSNLEMVGLMAPMLREIGFESRIEHRPGRVFDVAMNVLDSSRLTQRTGWVPKVRLEDGLIKTRDWLMSNRDEWKASRPADGDEAAGP